MTDYDFATLKALANDSKSALDHIGTLAKRAKDVANEKRVVDEAATLSSAIENAATTGSSVLKAFVTFGQIMPYVAVIADVLSIVFHFAEGAEKSPELEMLEHVSKQIAELQEKVSSFHIVHVLW